MPCNSLSHDLIDDNSSAGHPNSYELANVELIERFKILMSTSIEESDNNLEKFSAIHKNLSKKLCKSLKRLRSKLQKNNQTNVAINKEDLVFSILHLSALKLQHFFKSTIPSAQFFIKLNKIHYLCTLPALSKDDFEFFKAAISQFPDLKNIRIKNFEYRTITHSALLGSNIPVLSTLNPSFRDLLVTDVIGRSSIHYLGISPNMKIALCLAGILNSLASSLPVAVVRQIAWKSSFSIVAGFSNCSKVLKSGWLFKQRGVSLIGWKKRFFVLTEDSLSYYKNMDTTSSAPITLLLEGCKVKRYDPFEPIIEIDLSNSTQSPISGLCSNSSQNFYLKAENEIELQIWLKYLSGLTNSIVPLDISRVPTTRYVNQELRERWISTADCNGDTVLHYIVKTQRPHQLESIKFISWLVENGCPVNDQNKDGNTALHLAILTKAHKDVVKCLILKGADFCILKNKNDVTVMELVISMTQVEVQDRYLLSICDLLNTFTTKLDQQDLYFLFQYNKTDLKVFTGYTYLSLFIGKLSIADSSVDYFDYRSSLSNPYLKVSVYNNNDVLLEESIDIWNPVMVRSNMIYWGWDWNMHIPLENIPTGSFVIFEASNKSNETDKMVPICWLKYPIHTNTITSGPLTMRAEANTSYSTVKSSLGGSKNYFSIGSCDSLDEGAHLTVDVSISHSTLSC